MGDLSTLLGAGTAGTFVLVIFYLLNANRADRRDYQDAIDRAEDRANKAEARVSALNLTLDEVRESRRAAEDRAARLEAELHRFRAGAEGP